VEERQKWQMDKLRVRYVKDGRRILMLRFRQKRDIVLEEGADRKLIKACNVPRSQFSDGGLGRLM
jgi:hypothetical protein